MATVDEAEKEYSSILSQLSEQYQDIAQQQVILQQTQSDYNKLQSRVNLLLRLQQAGITTIINSQGRQVSLARSLQALQQNLIDKETEYLNEVESLTKTISRRVAEEEAYRIDEKINREREKEARSRYIESLKKATSQLETSLGIGPVFSTIGNIVTDIASAKGGMQKVITGLSGVAGAFTSLRAAAEETQKKLGTTLGTAAAQLAQAQLEAIKSITTPGAKVSADEIIDATAAFKEEFGTILDPGEARKIAQEAKALGVSAASFVQARRSFLATGDVARTQSIFTQTFVRAGLTQAQAFEFAAKNANLVAIAGVKYADALARAAANATRIGVSLSATERFADTLVGNFEGALENFAELSAMGFNVDFNRIAQVAGTGTPEEVQKELAAQFGGNQQLLNELQRNRFLKVSLERDLGLDIGEITRLAKGEGALPVEKTQAEKSQEALQSATLKGADAAMATTAAILSLIGALTPNTAATIANTVAMGGKLGLGPTVATAGVIGGAVEYNRGVQAAAEGRTTEGAIKGGLGGAAFLAGLTSLGLIAAGVLGAPITGGLSLGLVSAGVGIGAAGGAYGAVQQGKKRQAEPVDDFVSPPGYGSRALLLNNNDTLMAGTKLLSAGALTSPMTAQQQAPPVTNTVNVDMSKLEAKLDRLASAFAGIKIEMDGNTVGRVSLNARSPMDRLSVVG
jgi:hypothetical protein